MRWSFPPATRVLNTSGLPLKVGLQTLFFKCQCCSLNRVCELQFICSAASIYELPRRQYLDFGGHFCFALKAPMHCNWKYFTHETFWVSPRVFKQPKHKTKLMAQNKAANTSRLAHAKSLFVQCTNTNPIQRSPCDVNQINWKVLA